MTPEAQRWLDMADYDLGVARLCFVNGVYVYCVFFCHLALEKLLKAIVLDKLGLEEPPHTHNLGMLAEAGVDDLPEEYMTFLKDLTPYGVMARYPESPNSYDRNFAEVVLTTTEEVYSWLRSRLM